MYRPFHLALLDSSVTSLLHCLHDLFLATDNSHSRLIQDFLNIAKATYAFGQAAELGETFTGSRNSICVCVCGCFCLSHSYKQWFSPETHLRHSTEDSSGKFLFVSGSLPLELMVFCWCEHVCLCLSLRVYPRCEWWEEATPRNNMGPEEAVCLSVCQDRSWKKGGRKKKKEVEG